jgi:hypothetical protein
LPIFVVGGGTLAAGEVALVAGAIGFGGAGFNVVDTPLVLDGGICDVGDMCVCVCVCARARVCVCVCVHTRICMVGIMSVGMQNKSSKGKPLTDGRGRLGEPG